VEQAIRSLESSSDLFWLANSPPRQDTEYLVAHLANVGILSLRIGMAQGYSGERLVELGMAAFLFDVGMWRLPEAMLGKTEQLSDEEVAAIRSHPRLSAEIVSRWQPPLPSVVEMIQQHHEREQGQGYPQGLAGDAVNSGAKIIGLMDTYAALIHPRPYRPRFHPHEAVREILRSRREGFPSHLVKALLAEISVFPPRTVVKLNNGEVGRVIAVNRNHPLRPKVEIFADARGSRLAVPKILDLSEAPFLYITGPLTEAAR
jgi:HD-GYP domain-containing protein (c-di-GMP phosphodiesterase class II)